MATNNKRTLLTEVPKAGVYPDTETFHKLESDRQKRDQELITDSVSSSKDARQKSLLNAHDALVNAFGPKVNKMVDDSYITKIEVTESEVTDLIKELQNAPDDDDMVKECRQRLDEAKLASPTEKEKMYKDIHRKFWSYVQGLPNKNISNTPIPSDTDKAVKNFFAKGGLKGNVIQWISHEGSMIICSLIAVSDDGSAWVSLGQLPDEDREIILSLLKKNIVGFWASLDQYKNFECSDDNAIKEFSFTLGNRVASIPPNEATGRGDVKVERKGKEILIGDRIKLEKNRIQNLVSPTDQTNNGVNRGLGFQPRQKVSGRNAYEIRADVLEMALDFAKAQNDKKLDSDDVLDIAEAFYSFVEHK